MVDFQIFSLFFILSHGAHRYLHSFPTRRSSDLNEPEQRQLHRDVQRAGSRNRRRGLCARLDQQDRKSTRLNSSHVAISYAVFCLKKKITIHVELTCTKFANTTL